MTLYVLFCHGWEVNKEQLQLGGAGSANSTEHNKISLPTITTTNTTNANTLVHLLANSNSILMERGGRKHLASMAKIGNSNDILGYLQAMAEEDHNSFTTYTTECVPDLLLALHPRKQILQGKLPTEELCSLRKAPYTNVKLPWTVFTLKELLTHLSAVEKQPFQLWVQACRAELNNQQLSQITDVFQNGNYIVEKISRVFGLGKDSDTCSTATSAQPSSH